MKIEVGKKYIDRSGYTREVSSCIFSTACGRRYDANGKARDSSDDLIEEFVEPLIKYTGEYITRADKRVIIISCFKDVAIGYFLNDDNTHPDNPTIWKFCRNDGAFVPDERFPTRNTKFDIVKKA